jgi:hypothetical protein
MLGDALLGAVFAFAIATLSAPVGISGAVFLIPVQLSLLHTPSPAVTPTNLLYNLIAIPGALLRFRRSGAVVGPLARFLVLGTLPGVVIGAVIQVKVLAGPDAFLLVVAAVLIPLGIWLALCKPPRPTSSSPRLSRPLLALAFVVGIVGSIYGIGGGSILTPVLLGLGFAAAEIAPAALVATFLTSVAASAACAAPTWARHCSHGCPKPDCDDWRGSSPSRSGSATC